MQVEFLCYVVLYLISSVWKLPKCRVNPRIPACAAHSCCPDLFSKDRMSCFLDVTTVFAFLKSTGRMKKNKWRHVPVRHLLCFSQSWQRNKHLRLSVVYPFHFFSSYTHASYLTAWTQPLLSPCDITGHVNFRIWSFGSKHFCDLLISTYVIIEVQSHLLCNSGNEWG